MTALSERGIRQVVGRKHRVRRKHRSPAQCRRRLGFESLEPRRLLTMYVVNSLGDNTVVDGLITLREAIGAANCNCQVGDAPPGDPPGVATDSIRFDPSLAGGTIRLARSSTPFLVAEDVIIIGLGKDQLTIDGDVNGDGTGN